MPRQKWPLHNDRPIIQITLAPTQAGQTVMRDLLADTGAGNAHAGFELVLEENDCLTYGAKPVKGIVLSGAYAGAYPLYLVRVRLPNLGFDRVVSAVAVPTVPAGHDGIACFRFLNRFTYGNFGDARHFGLES